MNPTTVSLGPDQIRAMFTRRVKAFARRDARDASADFAADCVLESLTSGTVTGRAAVEEVYRAWFAAFPDSTVQEEGEPVIFSDRAVHFATVRGTDTGGFLGKPQLEGRSAYSLWSCAPSGISKLSTSVVFTISAPWLCSLRENLAPHSTVHDCIRRPLIERCSPMTSPLLQRFNKPCCHRLDLREPISR